MISDGKAYFLLLISSYNNADGGIRTPERSRAPALMVITLTFEAGVLPARLHLL